MAESTEKKPFYKKWWVWVIAVIILGAIGSQQGGEDNVVANKSAEAIKPISVPIKDLLSAYEGNEVGADEKYKGKYIQTKGVVGDIKKDIMDDLYVTVGQGKEFEIPVLQGFFLDKYKSELVNLKKGQQLEVICRIEGLMMNVLGKRCKIVK